MLEEPLQEDNRCSGQMEITDIIWMHRGKSKKEMGVMGDFIEKLMNQDK